jgi:hypothetical protein
MESTTKRQDQKGGFYDSIFDPSLKVYKVKKGINDLRFLPGNWKDADHFGLEVWIHRNIGPDNGTYLCRYKMKGEDCSICDERRELNDAGDTEAAKQIAARKSLVYWVIDRDNEDEGPQLHMWGYTLDEELALRCGNQRTGALLDISHEEDGYDVSFRRGDEKPFPKTTGIDVARQSSPLCDDERWQDRWLDFVDDHPLPETLNYYDNDYVTKILYGRGGKKDDDRDRGAERGETRSRNIDDDPPPRRSRRDEPADDPPPRRGRAVEDDPPRSRRDRSERDPEPEPQSRRRERLPDSDDEKQPGKEPENDTVKQARGQLDKMAREHEESSGRESTRGRSDPDDDPPPRRSRRDEPADDPPPRRGRAVEDDPPRSRRTRDENVEDDPPRRRSRSDRP